MTTRQDVSGDVSAVELTVKIEGISSTKKALIANLAQIPAQTICEHYYLSPQEQAYQRTLHGRPTRPQPHHYHSNRMHNMHLRRLDEGMDMYGGYRLEAIFLV